jgi:hypothetical protein
MRHADVRREMTALVRRWPAGRETQAAFAARHGISRTKLRYWLRRLRSSNERPPSIDFAPVRVMPSPSVDGTIEIVLVTGDRVLVSNGVSAISLHAVISVLRGSC